MLEEQRVEIILDDEINAMRDTDQRCRPEPGQRRVQGRPQRLHDRQFDEAVGGIGL
jgi:hypothetical protein